MTADNLPFILLFSLLAFALLAVILRQFKDRREAACFFFTLCALVSLLIGINSEQRPELWLNAAGHLGIIAAVLSITIKPVVNVEVIAEQGE